VDGLGSRAADWLFASIARVQHLGLVTSQFVENPAEVIESYVFLLHS
jgi:hypothetical protein